MKGKGEARCALVPGGLRFAQQGKVALVGFPHLCCPFSGQWLSCTGAVLGTGEGSKRRLEVMGQSSRVFQPGQQNLGCKQSRSYSCPKQAVVSQKEEKGTT